MIVDILMNMFDSGLPADTTAIDPFAAHEETFRDPDPLVALAQDQPIDTDANLPDILPPEENAVFAGDAPQADGNSLADSGDDSKDNAFADSAELDVARSTDADSRQADSPSGLDADAPVQDWPDTDEPMAIPDASDLNEFAGLTGIADDSHIEDSTPAAAGILGKSVLDPVFDLVSDIWERFFQPFFDPSDIVRSADFSPDGSIDTKNNLVVVGDVASDINFISEQTHGSCSLMAQEQFVHRLTGKPIPEEYLEWQAEKWGVYHPDIGTVSEGQEMVLDHFNIPYDRDYNPALDDIVSSMSKGNDVLIGVDAREFYQDPFIPSGAGHAVALVGRGLDPETGDLKGFYVTDSNYPGAAHFVPTERLEASWDGADMISVPENLVA